jgi:hypothetical protein
MASMDPTQIKLRNIGDLVFTPGYVAKLKEAGIDTLRGVYELSSATTQCANVTDIRNPQGTPCYICGIPIDNTNPNDGLNGECEHILAIAQAIIFLGLYWHKAAAAEKEGQLFIPSKEALKLEYAWAHRTCNQVKSDRSFIKFHERIFKVNDDKLQAYLYDIYTNDRVNSANFNIKLGEKYTTADAFVSKRITPVSNVFQQICNYLNAYEAPELLNLIGAAAVMEGPMDPRARNILSKINGINTSGLKVLANTAIKQEGAIETVKKIADQVYELIPPSVRPKFQPTISEILEMNGDKYINLIVYTPSDINNLAVPYIKMSILSEVITKLDGTSNRSTAGELKMIKDKRIGEIRAPFLRDARSRDAMSRFNAIATTVGLPPIPLVGGRHRKSIKRRHRKLKTRKNRRNYL